MPTPPTQLDGTPVATSISNAGSSERTTGGTSPAKMPTVKQNAKQSSNNDATNVLPMEYVEVMHNLDKAYDQVNEEHECNEMARRIFTRQAALVSFFINMSFLACGALFFASQTDWDLVDVALFTVYTVTSAGYGHVEIPGTPLFQIVDTFYILIGMSLMAIMMAQVYKFLEMEAVQIQQAASNRTEVVEEGIDKLTTEPSGKIRNEALSSLRNEQKKNGRLLFEKLVLFLSRVVHFSVENKWGDFLYRVGALVGLASLGGITVGLIEQWPWYTCMYWSIVSLTTVGYGDVVPQTVAGKVITTVWLPLNLFFLSILFCSVGHYYLNFSERRINKIAKNLQEKRKTEFLEARMVRMKAQSSGLESDERDVEEGEKGRESIPRNINDDKSPSEWSRSSLPMNRRYFGANLSSMKEVLEVMNSSNGQIDATEDQIGNVDTTSSYLMSEDAPNFYLRVTVKERLAFIIAHDVAGRNSSLTVGEKPGMLSLFLGGTIEACEKWMIPRSVRPAFRAVALEALLFVGESRLIDDGMMALHSLTPLQFHRIFSPFLVAMGNKGTLQSWLISTQVLWENESKRPCPRRSKQVSENSLHFGHKDYVKTDDKAEFPTNHAEGFRLFQDTKS